jgi:hypothetical protein
MAKISQKSRGGKFADEKYLGPEPLLTNRATTVDLCYAYNWFNYFYTDEDSKNFTLTYLKQIKYDKTKIKLVSQMRADKLHNIGWNCRMVSNGGDLPEEVLKVVKTKLDKLIANEIAIVEDVEVAPVSTLSIQDRINNKASALIADLEDQVDIFIREGRNRFDPVAWMRTRDVKPQIAQKIVEYYKPLYSELYDAMQGKDEQLKEAYSRLKKIQLKSYIEFIRSIIASAEGRTEIAKATRKPRAKKVKPVAALVSKVKYKPEDTEYNITSIKPTEIIGCQQFWVFNSKYRTLSVYNAMIPSGLNVKGTTITGFDEKTSITKKLRNPKSILPLIPSSSKVTLRKLIDTIKATPKVANGRLNMEVVLLKAIK